MTKMKDNQQGFTIVELMIATTILSVILVMVSVVMIGIGSLYIKGINQSKVQGSVRSIIDEVSQQLETSKHGPLTGPDTSYGPVVVKTYCVGITRYSYVIGHQIGDGVRHVLWRDRVDPATCPPGPNLVTSTIPSPGGIELIAPGSRLTAFPNDPSTPLDVTSPYEIVVGVAYGETDLLTATSGLDVRCNNTNSRQFCAAAHLETTVLQRLSPGSN